MTNLYAMTSFDSIVLWIALTLAFLFIILLIVSLRLAQVMRQRTNSLYLLNQNLKQELIDHSHSEEAKQRLEKTLLQNQKLQAIGTLAGGIAHDFNNLLYAVIGYVEMAREDVPKEGVVFNNLGKVLEATKRGQDLIASILAFSRRQQLKFKVLNLQTTLETVLSLLRPTIPAGVTINFEPLLKDCIIQGDETQLHQVIVNLINNAVDAMDNEGTITIRVESVPTSDSLLKQVPHMKKTNYCKIEIKDTGQGMDQRTIERIFEPFFTTKEVGKGTGLGLSTVHTIITDHHGEISVNSQLGRGTTFNILLPEYKEHAHVDDFISRRR